MTQMMTQMDVIGVNKNTTSSSDLYLISDVGENGEYQLDGLSEKEKGIFNFLIEKGIGKYFPVGDFKPLSKEEIQKYNSENRNLETAVFMQLNYLKMELSKKLRAVKRQMENLQLIQKIVGLYEEYNSLRGIIFQANENLCYPMIRMFCSNPNSIDYNDYVSRANESLLDSIGGYNPCRGIKFSTYACRAILRGCSKQKRILLKRQEFSLDDFSYGGIPDVKALESSKSAEEIEHIRNMLRKNPKELDLSETELKVIQFRYGLDKNFQERKPLTLKGTGEILGLSKERIRQIQERLLLGLRKHVEESEVYN
ncbi:MAG: sigma-70 family RNA polymerase sigma factor [Candidatus Pacearchaeota archaeon]